MSDKYYRLMCFVVDICPELLREIFIKLAKNDKGISYTSLDAYLAYRQRDVMQLKMKRRVKLNEDQYDLLYPGCGKADVKQWDVTLLATLITELFPTSLQPLDIFLIKTEIRGIRNELHHLPSTSNMTDDDFEKYWGRLEIAAKTLAKQVFDVRDEASFLQKMEFAKRHNFPNSGDCLREGFEDTLNEVKSNTSKTASDLKQVIAETPGTSDDITAVYNCQDALDMDAMATSGDGVSDACSITPRKSYERNISTLKIPKRQGG